MAYFISYFSRVNLSAALVEVINSGFAGKKTAALALTVCSITYGAGQIISGFLGDRFKPQNLILTGFAITTVANGCVGLMTNDVLLVPLWGINGFAQALMWPPLVVIMAKRLARKIIRPPASGSAGAALSAQSPCICWLPLSLTY